MFKAVGAYLLSFVLLWVSSDAFRQMSNEFRDTEPGSLLFGVLQLVIGTSAVVGAIGLVTRSRWASWAIGICGVAAVSLLASQPLFEPMSSDVQWTIWFGASVVGAVAAGMSWIARRLAKPAKASHVLADAAPIIAPAPYQQSHFAQSPAAASTQRHDDAAPKSGTSIQE